MRETLQFGSTRVNTRKRNGVVQFQATSDIDHGGQRHSLIRYVILRP